MCCLVLRSSCALLLTIQFALLFFFFFIFFSATILSGPYLWNHYSQRLQIECAAWFCSLILHYCLPSNSLCYFFFSLFSATILSGPYLWNRYSQRLQIECAAWSCSLILHCCLPSNSLRYWTKVRGIAPRSHTGRPWTCLVMIRFCLFFKEDAVTIHTSGIQGLPPSMRIHFRKYRSSLKSTSLTFFSETLTLFTSIFI